MNRRMVPLSSLAAQLAFQVDRKILLIEEESYLRLDLSAHEAAALQKTSFLSGFFPLAKRFVAAALVIYAGLFALTNAPAYAKIIHANLVQQLKEEEQEVIVQPQEEEVTEAPLLVLPVEKPNEELLSLSLVLTTYEDRIKIPSIGVNAPVVETELGLDALVAKDWNTLEEQIHSTLLKGVAHYPGTAQPGKIGNAFYTGHSSNVFWEPSAYNTVFALLPSVQMGDDIYITHKQIEFHYKVISIKEVKPNDVSILNQGNAKHLTLMTCTPVGTALNRLVVTAELVP